jgi:hypothetical protein
MKKFVVGAIGLGLTAAHAGLAQVSVVTGQSLSNYEVQTFTVQQAAAVGILWQVYGVGVIAALVSRGRVAVALWAATGAVALLSLASTFSLRFGIQAGLVDPSYQEIVVAAVALLAIAELVVSGLGVRHSRGWIATRKYDSQRADSAWNQIDRGVDPTV